MPTKTFSGTETFTPFFPRDKKYGATSTSNLFFYRRENAFTQTKKYVPQTDDTVRLIRNRQYLVKLCRDPLRL